jgi:NitT/TauT family transport system permease protein
MLWFGLGSTQTVFVVSVLVFPTVFINTVEGMQAIDRQLLEMAGIYRASNLIKWADIYLPALAASILAGFSLAAGMAVRIVVMAELLGTSNGIGYAIAIARTNLDTPQLFAWILVCLVLVAAMELLIVRPIRKYLLRWQAE